MFFFRHHHYTFLAVAIVLVTVKQSSYVRVIREGEHDTGLASLFTIRVMHTARRESDTSATHAVAETKASHTAYDN